MTEIEMRNKGWNMSSLQGEIDISYQEIVNKLGPPTSEGDGYKVDAEWCGEIDDVPFTLYNYKDGHNYLGSDGEPVENIRSWHIGGYNNHVVPVLTKFLQG